MRRADVDQPGEARSAARAAQSRVRQAQPRRPPHAAADKAFAPGDAGLVERAHGDGADAAGRGEGCERQRLTLRQGEAPCGEPAELVFGQLLAAAAAAFLADDHGIELTCVVSVLHLARKPMVTARVRLRGHRVQAFEQRHQLGARGMVGDAKRERLRSRCFARQCTVMRLHQRAGAIEERGAVGGEPDRARRALDEALSQQCLEPLKLQADGGSASCRVLRRRA